MILSQLRSFCVEQNVRTFTERLISEYACVEAELDISTVLEHISSSHITKTNNLHKFMTSYCLQFVYLIKCGILKTCLPKDKHFFFSHGKFVPGFSSVSC